MNHLQNNDDAESDEGAGAGSGGGGGAEGNGGGAADGWGLALFKEEELPASGSDEYVVLHYLESIVASSGRETAGETRAILIQCFPLETIARWLRGERSGMGIIDTRR